MFIWMLLYSVHNIYSKIIIQWVALVGCVKAQGGRGGGTDFNPYISLHIPQRSILLHLS